MNTASASELDLLVEQQEINQITIFQEIQVKIRFYLSTQFYLRPEMKKKGFLFKTHQETPV